MRLQQLNDSFGVSKNPQLILSRLSSEQRLSKKSQGGNDQLGTHRKSSDHLKTPKKSSQQLGERSFSSKKDSHNNTNEKRNKWLRKLAIFELKQQQRKSLNQYGTPFQTSNKNYIVEQRPFQMFSAIQEKGENRKLIRQMTQSFGVQQNDKFQTIATQISARRPMQTIVEEVSGYNLLQAQGVTQQEVSSESSCSVESDQFSQSSSSIIRTKSDQINETNPYGKNKQYIGLEMSLAQQKKNNDEIMGINQNDMRQVLTSKFGVDIKFPANYNDQALIVPHLPDLVMCTCYHIIPKSKAILETNKLDGNVVQNYFSKTYQQNTGKSVLIRLLKANGRYGFEMLHEFQLKGISKCLIQFSKSGKYFSICLKTKNKLFIYDSTDIIMCCQKIRDQNADIIIEIPDQMDFGFCQRIVFDKNDRFVSLVSERSIFVYSLAQGKTQNPVVVYRLDEEQYCEINDFIIDSKGCSQDEAKCVIACKVTHLNQIQIFELKNPKANKKISFLKPTKTGVKLVVKISDDMSRVILSTGVEHYLHNGRSQENFPWIKDKFIRSVINDGHDFFLVTSKDYDRDVDILHSNYNEFNSSIKRRFEPGMLTLYDSIKYEDQKEDSNNKSQSKGYLKILMKVGDTMFLDTINIDLCYDENVQQFSHINSTSFKYYSAYSFNWPYFSFANYYNEVLIFNAFNTLLIQKFIMPNKTSRIHHTFLTDTHDLFIFCETTDEHFEQYTVDLDSDNPFLKGPICRYKFSLVEEDQCIAYHVRGSSHKERINLNHQLLTYMMHGTSLYFWNGAIKEIRLISQDSSNMCYLNDDTFLYMTTEEKQLGNRTFQHSRIIMIESRFGTFQKTEIYKDQDLRAEILTFGVDIQSRRLLILTGIKNLKEKRDKWVIIYDVKTEKLLYRVQIESREIIGRMKSNLYVFIDGHIYYGNKVIKIRYDLLERFKGREIKENILFNYYDSVLDLKPNQLVQSGTPLQSCLYNRLAFVIRNNKDFTSQTLLILPYLHERRIYLNRRQSANQFYTVVNRDEINYIICLCVDHNKIYLYTETGLLIDAIPYDDIVEIYGKPEGISENGQNFVFRKSELSPEINIMRLELEGILFRHSINVIKEFEEYVNDPNTRDKSISQNINQEQDSLKKLSIKQQKDLKVFWDYYLDKCQNLRKVKLQYFLNDSGDVLFQLKPSIYKKVNFSKILKKTRSFKNHGSDDDENSDQEDDEQFLEVVEDENQKIQDQPIQKKFKELVKQKIQNQQKNDKDQADELLDCNLFYFKAGNEQENANIQEFFYFDRIEDEINDLKGVSMNEDYIFFWNLNIIWKMSLKTKKLTKIPIQISSKESSTMIKRVRTGSDETFVTIRIALTAKKDQIVIWDLANEREIENFDIDSDALYFQDLYGNPYILEKDYIIMCKDGCRVRSFQAQLSMFDTENTRFSFPQGYRIEPKSHNWVVFRNFINLSFSYMTFVIKEYIEKVRHNHENYLFDLEGYDFILQHKTIFTDEKKTLVTQDYDKLSYILKNYYEINPMLLESLHYPNERGELPIHIAIVSNNHRMVNLILNYMSRIEYAAVKQLQNIFSQLIMFNGFEEYLSYCPFQTNQMVNKQTLKLQFREEKEIMAVEPSACSYVDDLYFRDVMGENEDGDNCRTYAVRIVQIRADWILNSDDGLKFLHQILNQGNKDLLMSNYVKIIIQFLFNRYSEKITKYNVPPYILHLIAVILNILFSEKYRIMIQKDKYNQENNNLAEIEYSKKLCGIFEILCLVCACQLFFIFLRQTWYLGKSSLSRGWTILDIIIIIFNFLVCCDLFFEGLQENTSRICEAFLVLCMFIKSLYFLRLDSRISPLVDSVFTILIEIKHFLIVYLILLAGFIAAFYNIGQAQCSLMLDEQGNADTTECSTILYYGLIGATSHVWESALGGFNDASYSSQPQLKYIVWTLFFLLSFFMQIHLLNMLIAMMGESFQQNNEIKESKKQQSQLSFVVDNWFIDPIQNKNKIVYIVAAFLTEEQDHEIEKFEQIKNSINEMTKVQKEGITEIRQIQLKLRNLSTILYQQQSLIDQETQKQIDDQVRDKKSVSSREDKTEQYSEGETNDIYKKLKL